MRRRDWVGLIVGGLLLGLLGTAERRIQRLREALDAAVGAQTQQTTQHTADQASIAQLTTDLAGARQIIVELSNRPIVVEPCVEDVGHDTPIFAPEWHPGP